jgi:hypothetical protein
MNETLQEYTNSHGVPIRVDRHRGIIRGVKILGLISRNGRRYESGALLKAAPLYEGVKVNVNHSKGAPPPPRDYQDRIGVIRNVAVRGDEGLFGDFHFNPRHALAEQLAWDAEHAPENVGFSHNVQATTSRRADTTVVEVIHRVESVDLVADPATTRGLFEHRDADASGNDAAAPGGLTLAEATVVDLNRSRPDLVDELRRSQQEEVQRLRRDLDRARLNETLAQKRQTAQRLLHEFRLPLPATAEGWHGAVVSPEFFDLLMEAPDETAMRRLVEDRARLAGYGLQSGAATGRPRSREQEVAGERPSGDAATFVKAIT